VEFGRKKRDGFVRAFDVRNVFIGDIMPFGVCPLRRSDFSNVTKRFIFIDENRSRTGRNVTRSGGDRIIDGETKIRNLRKKLAANLSPSAVFAC